jgi:hypothetical protein
MSPSSDRLKYIAIWLRDILLRNGIACQRQESSPMKSLMSEDESFGEILRVITTPIVQKEACSALVILA